MYFFEKLNVNVLLVFAKISMLRNVSLIPSIKPIKLNKCYTVYKYFFHYAMPLYFILLVS